MRSLFAALALFAVPALAQAQQQPPNPCRHGSTRMSIAGTDIDAMRCENAIANATIADLTWQNIKLMAALKMMEGDAVAVRAEAEAAKKAEADKKVSSEQHPN